MSIHLSCGHQVQDIDKIFNTITKGTTRTGFNCLEYKTVCEECYNTEEHFEAEDDSYKWLTQQPIDDSLRV